MTVVSVAQDSRSECRHRAALIPAGGSRHHARFIVATRTEWSLRRWRYSIDRCSLKRRPPIVAASWVKSG